MRGLNAVLRAWMSKRALVMVFVICALPVCFSTALLTPPGQSPDEPAHIVRAEGLLRGAIRESEGRIGELYRRRSRRTCVSEHESRCRSGACAYRTYGIMYVP